MTGTGEKAKWGAWIAGVMCKYGQLVRPSQFAQAVGTSPLSLTCSKYDEQKWKRMREMGMGRYLSVATPEEGARHVAQALDMLEDLCIIDPEPTFPLPQLVIVDE